MLARKRKAESLSDWGELNFPIEIELIIF